MSDLRAESAAVCDDIQKFGRRLEMKLEGIKTEIVNGIIRMILGALVIQIAAEVGAMLAVAKLVGH
jgi:hypothetical protein